MEVEYSEGVYASLRSFRLDLDCHSKFTVDRHGSFPTVAVEADNTHGVAGCELVQLYVGRDFRRFKRLSSTREVRRLSTWIGRSILLVTGMKVRIDGELSRASTRSWWFSAQDVKAVQTFVISQGRFFLGEGYRDSLLNKGTY